MQGPRYAPYRSDSESDEDTDSESSTSTDTETSDTSSTRSSKQLQIPEYSRLAQELLRPIEGFQSEPLGTDISGYCPPSIGYEIVNETAPVPVSNLLIKEDPNAPKIESSQSQITNIIMIDSRNRDRSYYPQPTDVTLQLPRTYKNISNFQVVQIKLLSAFYYFRKGKENIFLTTLEFGRTIPDGFGNFIDNLIQTRIREGTYDINSLLNELSTKMNQKTKFYDFVNGFLDFAV